MRSMQFSTVSYHKHEVNDIHELHIEITAAAYEEGQFMLFV